MSGNYDEGFYEDQRGGSARSAEIILPPLLEILKPRTVCDVGCGLGTWLVVASNCGSEVVQGFDGPWAAQNPRRAPTVPLQVTDLSQPIQVDRRFDLAMSLEVAEHLPSSRAESFVADLCALSDVVLFGAAIPGQGGEHHINEQWQSYWRDHFTAHGYVALDTVRPRVWDNPHVEWWYAQNTFLYVRESLSTDLGVRLQASPPAFFDAVHPRLDAIRRAPPRLRHVIQNQLPAAVGKAVRHRLGI